MAESQNLREGAFRARVARAYRETLGRELSPEIGHLVVAATRILLATIGLSSAFRLMPASAPITAGQQIVLAGYLVFALAVMVARLSSWAADVRLRRLAPLLDRLVCLLIVAANPDETLLYVPFLLFLFLAPAGRLNRLWLGLEYIVLGLVILLHNRIADWWPALPHADPQLLLLQFTLMLFTAVSVLGFRLGHASRQMADQWTSELYDISVNARQLPIDGIARKLADRFNVTDLESRRQRPAALRESAAWRTPECGCAAGSDRRHA
jgi:hypothetical protein